MPKKIFSSDFITLADLYLAYKKAKSEAFFDNLHPCIIALSTFEQNLRENIEKLHGVLTKGEFEWWEDQGFIGEYLYIPKSIDDSEWDDIERTHFRSVDPVDDWRLRYEESGERRLKAEFRLIISASAEYQIISALWILKVGHLFEDRLDKNHSYGNRLRRRQSPIVWGNKSNGDINEESIGLFNPYFSAYRSWRQNGLDAMRRLVDDGKSVTAITMDLASFYHKVSPDFILKPSFLNAIDVQLNSNEKKFTQLLIASINKWYKSTPDYKVRKEGALPVGLSSSKILSNVVLYELDVQISSGIDPEYYGRYVDDIFLVFETPSEVVSGNDVLNYLSTNIECLKIKKRKGEPPDLRLKFGYASDSDLQFKATKQKIFSLSSGHGLDLINQISSQIRAQSSEYRMMPEVPDSSVAMAEKALLASSDASLIADALRKADVVSIKRLGLSLLIRDIESYSSDLSRGTWAELRNEFYDLAERYLLAPKGLFDLFSYLPRIFRLMISNYDFDRASGFIDQLNRCFELLEKTTTRSVGGQEKTNLCRDYFSKILFQTAIQASTSKGFDQWHSLRKCVISIYGLSNSNSALYTKRRLEIFSQQLLLADLGSRPYKDYWYYSQSSDINEVKVPRSREIQRILKLASVRKFRESAQLRQPHWPALVFPTRPLSIQEIALISPKVLDDHLLFRRSIWGLRGAKTLAGYGISRKVIETDGCRIKVPKRVPGIIRVALTNFETTDQQFMQALKRDPDRSVARYEKINKLINEILSSKTKCDYVVFPECSIPRRWAVSIASKLAKQGVSLICGIEYYDHTKGRNILRNDCMVSLVTRWPGYNSNFLVMQPKLQPSHGEAEKLKKAKKSQYVPLSPNEILPIYEHGDFFFGVLICSDMTNPNNRVRFQGKIDSLFVLEWNPDVKTFSFLVEGASHDIHTFVIQVNNRSYGDSRVRAPYRLDYKRDSVRIKGGISDHFVIASIDYQALRRFQIKRKMVDKNSEFKPVPIGFQMCQRRKMRSKNK